MSKIKYLMLIAVMAVSCSQRKNNLMYSYTYNDLAAVMKEPSLTMEDSSNKNYCLKLNEFVPYGITWKMSFRDIEKGINKVIVKARVKISSKECKGRIVCAIDKAGKNIFWDGISLLDFAPNPGEWTEVIGTFVLHDFNDDNNVLVIYPLNDGKGDILFDDLTIELIK